jgi:hypothetical protein
MVRNLREKPHYLILHRYIIDDKVFCSNPTSNIAPSTKTLLWERVVPYFYRIQYALLISLLSFDNNKVTKEHVPFWNWACSRVQSLSEHLQR